ncbi:hypothetical protein KIL84_001736 [Mauremys mutica]|uniref:Bcl-2 Bcl-2 homology region 1-3 domain-containing protein n=1 Tax=Mauremys mutica TaxID=74926 RepID=A0A9D3XIX8_9SAUR|nr:hypothetical protein KIL84_001736 [Mauremys mutica]
MRILPCSVRRGGIPGQQRDGDAPGRGAAGCPCSPIPHRCREHFLHQANRSVPAPGCMAGQPPLPALAAVSEEVFRDGINWGRVVVFFYFTYRVIAQALGGSDCLRSLVDWALNFLWERVVPWIQQQGGWSRRIVVLTPEQEQFEQVIDTLGARDAETNRNRGSEVTGLRAESR